MTARSTSSSRAGCCCPCDLASVVAVAAGTTWGDAIPCYASHMLLVLLYVLLYQYEKKYFFHGLHGYENKGFVHCRINSQTIFKFPDKLIGKGCPTTAVLSCSSQEIQRIASLHLAETLRPTALPHESALHL